jgi:hypothetical protein
MGKWPLQPTLSGPVEMAKIHRRCAGLDVWLTEEITLTPYHLQETEKTGDTKNRGQTTVLR